MKLADILDKSYIIPALNARSKKELIDEMTSSLARNNPTIDKEKLVQVILEREKLGSTGIGDGIAIPHGKLTGLDHMILSFGRSAKGIDFESMDGKPSHLFFLLVVPENSVGIHLKALATISRLLKKNSFRESLLKTDDPDAIHQLIIHKDEEF
ncbi:MAG: PTS sugar transporter subunit IIA [Deltaproteobacteria bacterium]|nr:PTS sugar transporter subunit IIA [Deltaproteobacteria bacterium]